MINSSNIDVSAVATISSIRTVLETYTVRTFQQAYENVSFTAIQKTANDRTYDTRHRTMLTFICVAPHCS